MPKLTATTTVLDGFIARVLHAGQELPDWANGLVGEHLLDESPATEAEPVEAEPEGEPTPVEAGGEPDFTKPAPAKRGRPRKKA